MRNLKQYPITQLEKENALEQAISHFTIANAHLLGSVTVAALLAVLEDQRAIPVTYDHQTALAAEISELEGLIAALPEADVIERKSLEGRLKMRKLELGSLPKADT